MRHFLAVIFLLSLTALAQAETRLLRFPDLHGDQVAFSYGGDLWIASASGGDARRLTSHPGLELFAKFSPDGQTIAFTGQYDGSEQVYIIPVQGGEPRQLTYYPAEGPLPERWGYDHQVYGWTNDGGAVLFRSLREGYTLTDSRLYTVADSGGLPVALPMPVSGAGALSPSGKQVVYSPLFRDFRAWKRYQGGWAQDLHIFDLDGSSSRNITNHVRTDRDPMWVGDNIYFVSDRDDYLNIYAFDPAGDATRQLTRHREANVRWASDDGSHRIVYELDGVLRILNLRDGDDRLLPITVRDDTGVDHSESVKVAAQLEGFDLSPNGERVLLAARGEVFSLPVEHGVVRNLTVSPGAHEREIAWSANGASVAYISDASGEEELYIRDHLGQSDPVQVTTDSTARLYHPVWSPDGESLAFGDSEARIYVVQADGRRKNLVADDAGFAAHDFSWSPDSRWLAYSAADPNGYRSLHAWDSRSRETTRITDSLFNEFNPVFSPNGEQLYFLSDRMFSPQIGSIEWNYALDRETGIYAFMLTADSVNPYLPRNQEGLPEPDNDSEEDADEETVDVQIEFAGLATRVVRVPVDEDNLGGLAVTAEQLLFVRNASFYYGRDAAFEPELKVFSIEDREAYTLAEGVQEYALAVDGGYVLVRHEDGLKRYAVKEEEQEAAAVGIDELQAERVRAIEYQQIFEEVWRRFRDHFYVRNMHGYDWEALRERFRPSLVHVAHRADLNYLIAEMIGELGVGHAYIAGGDFGAPERPAGALLGAQFELDTDSGRYRLAKILRGHNQEPKYRSPLTEPGIDADVGDYLLAINGRRLGADTNPYALLASAGGGLLELLVADDARGRNQRAVIVEPLTSENSLLYMEWVENNRVRVDRATEGRVGYLHVPDMGASGIYEFIKWYYGQIRKQGLIIDVRGNGGGNVSQMLINRLDRSLVFMNYDRGIDNISTYPSAVFTGPMAVLLDQDSASDGDIFPGAFKALGLGPLIGKRSWGGVVGITDLGSLMDGGTVYVPQFGTGSADGQWTIEGHGVEPDIEVDNPPEALLRGEDPQLERAIEEVLSKLAEQPGTLPPRPADPVKTPGKQP